jgi:hypothetical protein
VGVAVVEVEVEAGLREARRSAALVPRAAEAYVVDSGRCQRSCTGF